MLFKKLFVILLIILAFPAVLLVRILGPLKIIRFGRLENSRIGHFAMDVEIYLCGPKAGASGKRAFDIFYYGCDYFCNDQMRKMCERAVRVWNFARYADKINRLFPGAQRHIIPASLTRDVHGGLESCSTHFSFTPEEENLGRGEFNRLGIPLDSSYVCFSARDPAYLDAVLPKNSGWGYHNYRNSEITNYLPAAQELTRRGYYAVRMGQAPQTRLPKYPKVIDYAADYRTDFLDIYLGAKCKFFICDTSGIYAIPAIFRRPIVWVNFIPLEYIHTWRKDYLTIPKKLWLRDERRFLTFGEILGSKAGRFCDGREYEKAGIEVIENTPEEITALAIEMDERLKGRWKESREDEELQKRFWAHFKPSELNGVFLSRIGAEFLRQNKELLE